MISPLELTLAQDTPGYRFNQDSFILADFFRVPECGGSIADFCAGVGVVSVLIGMADPETKITAVEIDHSLSQSALANARATGLGRFAAVTGDIMTAPKMFRGQPFGAVVCNPPYVKRGAGRVSPNDGKARARYELSMTLEGLVKAAAAVLKPGGSLSIVMVHSRRDEYFGILKKYGFSQARLRDVNTVEGRPPKLFLSEARYEAGGTLNIEQSLVLQNENGEFTSEYERIIGRYAG